MVFIIFGEVKIRVGKICFLFCLALLSLPSYSLAEEIKGDSANVLIDSIAVETKNVFNTDSAQFKGWLFKAANRFHVKTRDFVISRELLLKKGEPYDTLLAAETERNLRMLPFIFDARVELENNDGTKVLKVTTSDRWTLAGGPSISRNAGQTVIEIGFEELNLLGYGQYLAFHRYFRSIDEDYSDFSFIERRLFSSRYYLSLYYNNAPEIGRKSLTLKMPLYSLSSHFSYGVSISNIDRIDEYYEHGAKAAQDRMQGTYFESFFLTQFGTYESKVQMGVNYLYADLTSSDRIGAGFRLPSDSLYHLIMLQMGLLRTEYQSTSRINGFRRIEDINLTNGAVLKYGRAFNTWNRHSIYDILSFSYQYSVSKDYGYLFLGMERNYWFKENIDFRRQLILSAKYYNNSLAWVTPVIAVYHVIDERLDDNKVIYAGENYGLRGYPKNFDNGEKLLRINYENRLFSWVNIMSVDIGAVQFVDLGQIRSMGEGFDIGHWLWSVGVGLRLGMEKISNAELMRIDLAYAPEIKNWQISAGIGQYIQ